MMRPACDAKEVDLTVIVILRHGIVRRQSNSNALPWWPSEKNEADGTKKREKFHHDGYCYSTLGLVEQAGLVDFLYKYVRADFLVKSFTVGLIKIYQYGMIIRSDAYWYKCSSQMGLMHFDDFLDFLELKERIVQSE